MHFVVPFYVFTQEGESICPQKTGRMDRAALPVLAQNNL